MFSIGTFLKREDYFSRHYLEVGRKPHKNALLRKKERRADGRLYGLFTR